MGTSDAQGGRAGGDAYSLGSFNLGRVSYRPPRGLRGAEPMTQDEAVRSLLLLGQVALRDQDFASAVEAYASVLKLAPDATASYNLGSLYARGLGVRQDLVEGARLFHQAELLGNGRAGKLCAKCLFDHICENLETKTPADVYAKAAVFVSRVYPEAKDARREVANGLFAVASTCLDKGAYANAAKVFRAAAEFADDGSAQYYLAMLYNAGTGLAHNDLAALYWLDRAVDSGAAEAARADRDGLLDAFRRDLAPAEFREMMAMLADWCEEGTPDVPVSPAKAARWRAVA